MDQLECDESKPYHAADSCFPLQKTSEPAWDLTEIFGRPIRGDCPLANKGSTEAKTVCINVQPEREMNATTIPAKQKFSKEKRDLGYLTCFNPPSNGTEFSINFPEQNMTHPLPLAQPRIHAFRSITGYGQERGGIQSIITNPSSHPLEVIYMESLPWYMKPYLHTLRSSISPPSTISPIQERYYRPGLDRKRGAHLELKLSIPPESTLTLSYDFEKAILRYTEYPPDANRGFDVAPAVIKVLPHAVGDLSDADTLRRGVYVRTTSLLLPLPTPDFSMPYNVIILTSTVMALGFGGIYNILVRRFVGADEAPQSTIGIAIAAAVAKARGRIRQIFTKATGQRDKVE
jgi:phosphatidylinositol glycan class T